MLSYAKPVWSLRRRCCGVLQPDALVLIRVPTETNVSTAAASSIGKAPGHGETERGGLRNQIKGYGATGCGCIS